MTRAVVPTLSSHTYHRDLVGRFPFTIGPLMVRLAAHLEEHPLLVHAEPVLSALREGGDLSQHISPMKAVRRAFKKATRNGDWSRYAKMMDLLLNKWGIFHFHGDNGLILMFVYLCAHSGMAYVIDILHHDGNWRVERRLVGIVAENWPDAGVLREVANGSSSLTEADLLKARMRGINMPVEIAGRFYLPVARGLMTDGSGYHCLTDIIPIGIVAKKFDPASTQDEMIRSPQLMMAGLDPDDPRAPWVVAAEQAGALAAQRRKAMAQASALQREAILRHSVHTLFGVQRR